MAVVMGCFAMDLLVNPPFGLAFGTCWTMYMVYNLVCFMFDWLVKQVMRVMRVRSKDATRMMLKVMMGMSAADFVLLLLLLLLSVNRCTTLW